MLKEYRYDGSKKFKLSKVSTNETSLEPDRKKAEKKEGVIFLFQAMDARDR